MFKKKCIKIYMSIQCKNVIKRFIDLNAVVVSDYCGKSSHIGKVPALIQFKGEPNKLYGAVNNDEYIQLSPIVMKCDGERIIYCNEIDPKLISPILRTTRMTKKSIRRYNRHSFQCMYPNKQISAVIFRDGTIWSIDDRNKICTHASMA